MTKSEARILRNLYVFCWDAVPLRNSYDLSAAKRLEEENLILLTSNGDESWAEPLRVQNFPFSEEEEE